MTKMDASDRNKLVKIGCRLLRLDANGTKITQLTRSGGWSIVSSHLSKEDARHEIEALKDDPFAIFETNDIIEIPILMSEDEALEKHNQLKSIHKVARSLLLEMRDRKGWLALGYTSFEEYGEKEWNYSQSYIYRLSKAEKIQQSLNSPLGEIPETHLRPLGQIPPEERQAIFDEANKKAEEAGKERTAKMVEDAVKEWKEKYDRVYAYSDQLEKEFDQAVKKDVDFLCKEKVAELEKKLDEAESKLKESLPGENPKDSDLAASQGLIKYQESVINSLRNELKTAKEAIPKLEGDSLKISGSRVTQDGKSIGVFSGLGSQTVISWFACTTTAEELRKIANYLDDLNGDRALKKNANIISIYQDE